MKKHIKYYMAIIITCLYLPLFAQSSNFGSLVEAEIGKRFFKKLEASLSAEWRQREDLGEVDRLSAAAELSFRFNQYIKVGAAYNYIQFNHEKRGWETRHRYIGYVTGNYKYRRVKFSLRERFQSTYREGVKVTAKRANPRFMLRSKFGIDYNIRKSPFEPFISAEMYNTLNDPRKNYVDRIRYEAGTGYKINKKNSLSLSYRYTDYATPEDGDIVHAICVGYKFRL